MAAILLENRTISMILTVPDVDISSSSTTPIIERLDRSDTMKLDPILDNETNSSMPVYQGSIVCIEQHTEDRNISDLIIRVPNFQHASSPTIDSTSRSSTRIKRRAPLCPTLFGPDPQLSTTNNTQNFNQSHQIESRTMTPNRITTGLRSLSRAFTYGCISKRTTSISEIITPHLGLPDVEVMNEKLQVVTTGNKNPKYSTPKLIPPKILSVKRKHSKMKKSSTESNKTQIDQNLNRLTSTPTPTIATTSYAEVIKPVTPKVTSFLHRFTDENSNTQEIHNKHEDNNADNNNNDKEQQNESIRLSFDVEQHFAAIAQLIADIRVSPVDAESLSTHRYSTISANIADNQITITDHNRKDVSSFELPSVEIPYDLNLQPTSLSPIINRPFRVQTSILQPDISVIRVGTNDFTIDIDQRLPNEKNFIELTSNIEKDEKDDIEIENNRYEVIQTNVETLAECYEVTYQIDTEQQITEQAIVSSKITIDPFEYRNLALIVSINETDVPSHNYEQIEHEKTIDQNDFELDQFQSQDRMTQSKSCSVDDLSPMSDDQTSTYQSESIVDSSSSAVSKNSSEHCIRHQSNSHDDLTIPVSTEIVIQTVGEKSSPDEQVDLEENNQILCMNDIPVIQEDYTVIIQMIKPGLDMDEFNFDVMTHDAFEQFKAEIDQLNQ